MRERSPKVRAINISHFLLVGGVDILTSGAIDLGPCYFAILAYSDRDNILLFAIDSGTCSEFAGEIFFPHDGEPLRSGDEASMYKPIELDGLLIKLEESEVDGESTVGLQFRLRWAPLLLISSLSIYCIELRCTCSS